MKIIRDTREKTGWNFSRSGFDLEDKKLDEGDYTVEGLEDILVVERKKSIAELYANFTSDRKRFFAMLDRLKKYSFKIIIVEDYFENIWDTSTYFWIKHPVAKVKFTRINVAIKIMVSTIIKIQLCYGVHFVFVGEHGEQFAKNMFEKALDYKKKNFLP